MDMSQILMMVRNMFPNSNIDNVIQKAQGIIQGTPDNLQSVSAVAKSVGIDQNSINNIFQRYGNTTQARMLCSMLGTTPENLKRDAESIVGASGISRDVTSTKFPRLK